jgi:hypothetical protein
MSKLLDALFGCPHTHCTFPITTKRGRQRSTSTTASTYIVCLDCGKEFPYDWQQMKVVPPAKHAA